ncbi:YDG domain-containing protein [Pseudomonas sp. B22129]|uniref:YDG domain-containing protein n=1 Tax=Pseudomonas sp. B22129 TaxID=3235111 RepID=UPI003784B105
MNRIFSVIWNHSLNAWVVASENASREGKRGTVGAISNTENTQGKGRLQRLSVAIALTLGGGLLTSMPALAVDLPNGGKVVLGNGQILTPDQQKMIINQSSQKLAIDWQSFNIGADKSVTFVQPGKDSVALNRVVGSDGSKIMGQLNANGQVFLVNPNGVLFGKGASVDVGGLVASTLDISNKDFAAGNYQFKGQGEAGNAAVVNQGTLKAGDGGAVALLGGTVSNEGVIVARQGSVALAAGNKISLDFVGDGLLNVQVDEATKNALVQNKQLIQADGGQVIMTAKAGDALLQTVVNNTGIIEARTLGEKGGKIVLLGGFEGGTVQVAGTLDASAPTGNGGFIETSGAHVKVADSAQISTAASRGKTGTWLVDPTDFTIAASGGDMSGATVTRNLQSTNVQIQSDAGSVQGLGDIHVNDSITWSANTLTFTAQNTININRELFGSGSARLVLQYGQGAPAAGNTAKVNVKAPVNLAAGQHYSTKQGRDGAQVDYTVITDLGAAGSTSGADLQGINGALNGHFVLGANIDAGATSGWNGGAGFDPLGGSAAFTGVLEGNGHFIKDLTLNRPGQNGTGLFGAIGGTGQVGNLGLNGGSVNGGALTGALAGSSAGTLSNVFSSAAVSGSSGVGGLVGELSAGGVIRDAYASGTVNASQNQAGGLVGNVAGGQIDRSYASGAVTAAQGTVGGLAGGNANGQITNSFWNITGTGLSVGTPNAEAGATGLTDEQAHTRATFANAGWDMNGTWVVYDGISGPYLRNFMTQLTYTANSAAKTYDGQAYAGGYSASAQGDSRLVGNVVVGGTGAGAIDAGDYSLQLSGLASTGGQYGYSINYVDGRLSVGKASLSQAGATVADKVYDGTTTASVTGAVFNGVMARDVGRLTTTGQFDSKNVGTRIGVTLGLDGEAAGNYFLTPSYVTGRITPKDVTVTQVYADKVYDGSQGTSVHFATLQGVVNGEQLGFTGNGIFNDRNVGLMKPLVVLNGTLFSTTGSASNYRLVTPVGLTSAITPRLLTVSGITVNDKVYDGNTTGSVNLNNVRFNNSVAGDSLSVANAIALFSDKNVGAGKAVDIRGITLGGLDAGNYQLNALPVFTNATITAKSLAVSGITAANKTYDGNVTADLNTLNPVFGGIVPGDSLWIAGAIGRFTDKNAGSDKTVGISSISLGGQDRNNYMVPGNATARANISLKSLSLSNISAYDKVYDASTFAYLNLSNYRLDGLLAGDWVELAGAVGSFTDKNVGAGKIINVSFSLLGNGVSNYLINPNVVLRSSITPKEITVNAISAANKVYDGTTLAALDLGTATIRDKVRGDDLSVGAATGHFNDKNAGAKNVTISDLSLSGADAGNYWVSGIGGASAFITPKDVIVTGITANNKVYDSRTSASLNVANAAFNGLVAGDQLAAGFATGRFSDKNVGVGKTVEVSNLNLTGADARNYRASTGPTTADITPKEVNIWGVRAANKAYDGTTVATLNLTGAGVDGLVWGDYAFLTGATGYFFDKNAEWFKPVGTRDFTLGGQDAGNYTVGGMITRVSANITPKFVTVSGITADNKVYDTTTNATLNLANAHINGLVEGDHLAVDSSYGRFANQEAGIGKGVHIYEINLAGSDLRNYTVHPYADTTADITKAALTVSVNDASKLQGQPNPVFGVTYKGFLGEDRAEWDLNGDLAFSTTATGSSAAGVYRVSAGGQSATNYDIAYIDGQLTVAPQVPGQPPLPQQVPLAEVVSTVRPLHNLPAPVLPIAPPGPRRSNDLYTLIDQGLRLPEGL